jgi:hypothetical protein
MYGMWMGRVLAQVHPTVGARLGLGLGPLAHWTSLLAGQAMWLMLVALALLAVQLFPNWDVGHGAVGWLMIGIVIGALVVIVVQLPAALWASRREQSLLRLLPGTPQGVQLNRWLAGRLVGVHMAVLLLQGSLMAAMSDFVDSSFFGGQAVDLALAGLVLTVPLVFTLWRSWADAKEPAGGAQGLMVVVALAILGLAAAWVLWLDRPWFELAALTLLLTLPFAWWRWRLISRAPSAWPVGRLG